MQDINALFEEFGRVEELDIDEEFISHMADESKQYQKHMISLKEIRQVHGWYPEYFINSGEGKRAPVILVGPTDAGRMIVVPIEPTRIKGIWHPVTAFDANNHHIDRYQER